ncbi:DUF6660 family protein [Chryseobacterium sp. MMS23-Vi53]|uniref:DUF6660 family protein n=1 Tax=Chryseobacterium sp. MMS23-Vi53 TaxID=3386644 RepID=UPI0039EC8BDA
MNILRLLLTIYFMVLSLVPCSDVHAQSPSINEVLQVTFQTDTHSKDKSDVCSPLCSCNCCQITVTSFKSDPLIEFPEQVQAYFSKKILFRKNNFAYQVYDHIWQPPKI